MIKDRLDERTLTPQEVRTILKADNKEIVDLCKKAEIRPRKNAKGHTYFSYDEVKNLRKVQAQVREGVTNPISSKVPAAVGAVLYQATLLLQAFWHPYKVLKQN